MKVEEAFEGEVLGKAIDVVRVVVACHSGTLLAQESLLERLTGAGELAPSMVAGPAAVVQVSIDSRSEANDLRGAWQSVLGSAVLEVFL